MDLAGISFPNTFATLKGIFLLASFINLGRIRSFRDFLKLLIVKKCKLKTHRIICLHFFKAEAMQISVKFHNLTISCHGLNDFSF